MGPGRPDQQDEPEGDEHADHHEGLAEGENPDGGVEITEEEKSDIEKTEEKPDYRDGQRHFGRQHQEKRPAVEQAEKSGSGDERIHLRKGVVSLVGIGPGGIHREISSNGRQMGKDGEDDGKGFFHDGDLLLGCGWVLLTAPLYQILGGCKGRCKI